MQYLFLCFDIFPMVDIQYASHHVTILIKLIYSAFQDPFDDAVYEGLFLALADQF